VQSRSPHKTLRHEVLDWTLTLGRRHLDRVLASYLDGGRERAIMAAIIALAHAAGLTVVAEGIETRAQLEFLHELGADEIQGYFFSRPLV
jgi:EAL domain-containing protein (putative c-di-GMP-specific phosphodiesterase class I)